MCHEKVFHIFPILHRRPSLRAYIAFCTYTCIYIYMICLHLPFQCFQHIYILFLFAALRERTTILYSESARENFFPEKLNVPGAVHLDKFARASPHRANVRGDRYACCIVHYCVCKRECKKKKINKRFFNF